MGISLRYWDDCASPQDLEAMWEVPEVRSEWLGAGEEKEHKVHLSRDPDGQPYLTQTEMRAVAEIVSSRHFHSQIDPVMICAVAELESDRQLLVTHCDHKSKERTLGLMQLQPKTAEWLVRELGYRSYVTGGNTDLLFHPFVNVYFGAAYIEWLSNFQDQKKSEEFIVRAYKGGTKKATHKSTLPYWKRYLSVKESLPCRKSVDDGPDRIAPVLAHTLVTTSENSGGGQYTFWDSRTSPEDMEEMWNHHVVQKEWHKSKQKRGKVHFAHDEKKRPYLSRVELKGVADIIVFKYFSTKGIKPALLCALSEMVSFRFVNGFGERPGLMGIDYSTAFWLYLELGYRAYTLESVDDLNKPFMSMYFGAAYVAWLSKYEGRERSSEFVLRAYMVGPKNVNNEENGKLRLQYEEIYSKYDDDSKKNHDNCAIM
ncbi:hypothetical protein L6164_018107 [Bauhinia variegata]|uniref:Uncharacterized protein n=1 Tax=Bauhinia variegata TaxID=167791 RepID=A0ACB9NEY4_BAUVA|nr:hypothetical protein L6164_018107 [Bauhinia variegata]